MAEKVEVLVPSMGESVSSGVLARWLVADNEYVREGDGLFELETDKATLDVPSPASGTLHVHRAAGDEVAIGDSVASIDPSAEPTEKQEKSNQSLSQPLGKPPVSVAGTAPMGATFAVDTSADATPVGATPTGATSGTTPVSDTPADDTPAGATSPSVRRMMQEHRVDARQVAGSGRDGRITTKDVEKHIQASGNKGSTQTPVAQSTNPPPPPNVAQAHDSKAHKPATNATETNEPKTNEPKTNDHETKRVPLSRIRKRIAANLVASRQNAAHLTTFNEIDMTEVMLLRTQYKEKFEEKHGVRLGFMSFFVTAACHTLLKYPQINAFLEDDEIVYHNNCHIGVALASDKGLIVPVIRNAESKSFAAIEKEIKDFARMAQEHSLLPDSLVGGTFTITNGGVFGSLLSTPIPNPPQTAILGMHSIKTRPAVVEGAIVPRPLMYVALTYDHRLIDGKEGVGFLNSIKESIEEPARLMLSI